MYNDEVIDVAAIGGNGSGKEVIFSGSQTTNKWAEPLPFEDINIDNFEIVRFIGTDNGTPFDKIFVVSSMVVSSSVGDANYNTLGGHTYVYKNTSGELFFYVDTNFTLVLTDIIAYK